MPADCGYITILREPLELFLSTFVCMYEAVPAFHAFPQHGKIPLNCGWIMQTNMSKESKGVDFRFLQKVVHFMISDSTTGTKAKTTFLTQFHKPILCLIWC